MSEFESVKALFSLSMAILERSSHTLRPLPSSLCFPEVAVVLSCLRRISIGIIP